MSLLSEAKKVQVKKVAPKEEASAELVELAVAYAKKEITARQAKAVLNTNSDMAAVSKMRNAIISAVRTGKLS